VVGLDGGQRGAGEGRARVTDSWRTKRIIGHDEAREIASRLINSHFHKEPHARVGIPARPDYDDDLLISTYIKQQRERDAAQVAEQIRLSLAVSILTNERDEARVRSSQCG
jgi:hypothetical protein